MQGKPTEGPSSAQENESPMTISIKKHIRAEVKELAAEIDAYEALVNKVRKYIIWNKQRGGLPTLARMAKKFKVTVDEMENIAESNDDLDLVVGVRMGAGIYEFKTVGEYQIDIDEDWVEFED